MTFNKLLIFAAASSMAFTACGDDDDNKNNPDSGPTPTFDAGPGETPAVPALGTQIDRTGRPAVSTALIATFSADSSAKGTEKDSYNAAGKAQWAGFAASIEGSLAILDALDANCGNQLAIDLNPNDPYAGLAGVLADDQLYVNSGSGVCGTYLGLEAEVVGVLAEGGGGCGGRTLTDDIIDRSYSVLAAGVVSGVDDTITRDGDCVPSATFPFVCPPTI